MYLFTYWRFLCKKHKHQLLSFDLFLNVYLSIFAVALVKESLERLFLGERCYERGGQRKLL